MQAMDQLETTADEARLCKLAYDDGDRCAFIGLIEIMVDADRVDDLRLLARGDGRAFATLMEYLVRTDSIDLLRGGVRVRRRPTLAGATACLLSSAWLLGIAAISPWLLPRSAMHTTNSKESSFWKADREVFPDTREQRCWFHKQANVLSSLPKSAHPGATAAMKEIYNAEDIDHARGAIKTFDLDYGKKYPKAVAKIVDNADALLEFYKYTAEHWIHLRTTNPIESTFATERLRTKATKGPGSRAAELAMAYKLIEAARTRWRAVNAPHRAALVRAGARFDRGALVEREQSPAA